MSELNNVNVSDSNSLDSNGSDSNGVDSNSSNSNVADVSSSSVKSSKSSRKLYYLVFIGGAAGALVRSIMSSISRMIYPLDGQSLIFGKLTLGTFLSNMLACFIFALVASVSVIAVSREKQNLYKCVLGTGFCGGLSTMSTFAFEGAVSSVTTRAGFAILGIIVSFILGILMVFIGNWIGSGIARCVKQRRAKNLAYIDEKVVK